ncbi:GNAT family N-acetyltransferase [Pediococcus argentinicus]|uniref:Acetyltransferase n=1 Tax=Pediococcus argentinicus TaxID=480391 RepID=A0A0R2NPP5_9LACO|nr:GNAT family N-acetyltransferase [Pediococcus argentinicus]KRO25843.1 acetyltransferase [Pediococcus argentinicus]NKZ21836.1 GNAT family N-acetyltransferase [Pediococcus argentinicus]GEP19006.1 hypothetical protein LSA03_03900 [Pediococcus argentinicus]
MTEEVTFREAEAADAREIVNLFATLSNESDTFTVDNSFEGMSDDQIGQQLDLIQRSPQNFILLACLGPELIGIVTIIDSEHNEGAELGVAVKKEFWHAGIGSALVDEGMYWAEQFSALKRVWLDVINTNEYAVKIYQQNGFQKEKTFQDEQGRSLIRMNRDF